jgi:hypothetical protein
MIRGTIIAESIKPGSSLKGAPIVVTEILREVATGASSGQPQIWTVINFEAANGAERLADALSEVLDDGPIPWYCNFTSGDEVFIVYPRKVFRYQRGNVDGRQDAQNFGRNIGVPPSQLDWTE